MAGITIEVDLDESSADRSFRNIEVRARDAGQKTGASFEKGLNKSISVIDIAVGNILANIAQLSLSAITNFVSGSISAANRQEDAVNNLNAALKRTGEFSAATSRDLQDFAAQVERISIFGDEAVLEQLAFAKSLGLTSAQAKEVVTAAVNLSSALGISLESATRNIAKTFSGLQGELGELLPSLRNLTQEQLKAGDAARLVNKEFSGAAQSRIETARGSYEQLSNAIGSAAEALGSLFTQSKAVASVTSGLTGFFNDLASTINPSGQPVSVQINNVKDSISKLQQEIARLDSVGASSSVIENRRLQLLSLEGQLERLRLAETAQATESIQVQEQAAARSLQIQEELNAAKKALDEKNKKDGASLSLEDQAIQFDDFFNQVGVGLKSFAKQAQITGKSVASALTGGVANAASSAFSSFGKALVSGENALQAFGQALLQVFGQALVQLGTGFILQGIAQSIAGFGSGAPLIAAGAALATFGGVLSAIGGGSSASAPSQGEGSSVGGGFNNFVPAQTPQEDLRERETGVTINIQGDVLDGDESALRLAELVQSAISNQGVRFT